MHIKRMVPELLLIILLFYAILVQVDNSPVVVRVDSILKKLAPTYRFEVVETDNVTRCVGKKRIELKVRNRLKEFKFDVVLLAAIHELAHIVSNEVGHTAKFKRNEKQLIEAATSAGYLSKVVEDDSSYL